MRYRSGAAIRGGPSLAVLIAVALGGCGGRGAPAGDGKQEDAVRRDAAYPAWLVGTWEGQARELSDSLHPWSVILVVGEEMPAVTMVYRRGVDTCIEHPVMTIQSQGIQLRGDAGGAATACEGVDAELTLDHGGADPVLRGEYTFRSGRRGNLSLTLIDLDDD